MRARPAAAYGKPLLSAFQIVGRLGYCLFRMFWTGLTFLPTALPSSYPGSQIGAVGLSGLARALPPRRAGRPHDRRSVASTGLGFVLSLVSMMIAWRGATSIVLVLVLVLVAVLLLDIAIPAVNESQSVAPFVGRYNRARRLNTAFVVSSFVSGAIGSAISGTLWTWAAGPCLPSAVLF